MTAGQTLIPLHSLALYLPRVETITSNLALTIYSVTAANLHGTQTLPFHLKTCTSHLRHIFKTIYTISSKGLVGHTVVQPQTGAESDERRAV